MAIHFKVTTSLDRSFYNILDVIYSESMTMDQYTPTRTHASLSVKTQS